MSTKGLGPRGIDALFGSTVNAPAQTPNIQAVQETDVFKEIPTLSLIASTVQPRKTFDEVHLKELASSIQEKGIVQPIVVRSVQGGKYEIIAGERRFRAAKLLGLETVPTIIRDYTDAEIMTIALIENIQRENLNPVEEAEAFATLKETYKLSQEELAKSLGKSRPSVANALRLLNLPENIRAYMLEGKLSAAHGRTLLALDHKELLDALTDRIVQYSLSVRDTENLVEYANAYQRLPELTVTASLNPLQEAGEAKTAKAPVKRRITEKPKTFVSLQKQLRSEVHRGTSISGNIENGKIVLPFSGKQEFESLLKLLSVKNFKSIVAEILTAAEEQASASDMPVEDIEGNELNDILTNSPVDVLAEEVNLETGEVLELTETSEDVATEESELSAELSEDELAMQEAALEEAEIDATMEHSATDEIEEFAEISEDELEDIEAIENPENIEEITDSEETIDELSAEVLEDFDAANDMDLPEIAMPETGAEVTNGDDLFNVLDEVPESVETLDDLAELETK